MMGVDERGRRVLTRIEPIRSHIRMGARYTQNLHVTQADIAEHGGHVLGGALDFRGVKTDGRNARDFGEIDEFVDGGVKATLDGSKDFLGSRHGVAT